MPSFAQFIQTPEAFLLETVIEENPQFMDRFIDYITIAQDPLLSNECECYLYPSKIAQILSVGMAYRLIIKKKQADKQPPTYPYLHKLFSRVKQQKCQTTLMGYCNRVLISLVKKTPEIYEFIKDSQQLLIDLLKDDAKLDALKEFFSLFLVQSTMELYVFLKSMVMRTLILRVVEEDNAGIPIYKCISYFYQQILKALQEVPEDQKGQLVEVAAIFQEEHFITLLILKLDPGYPNRSTHIVTFLCRLCPRSAEAAEIISLHIDTILEYLEDYEQSSIFMDTIRTDHISLLTLLVQLTKKNKLAKDIISQIIKRLLVYSNIHSNNSFVHNLLIRTIQYCEEQQKEEILTDTNIIQFFIQNKTEQYCGFMALRKRVFAFWVEHNLCDNLNQEEREIVTMDYNLRNSKLQKCKYYKNESKLANHVTPQIQKIKTSQEQQQPKANQASPLQPQLIHQD